MENQTFSSQCHADGAITIRSGARLTIENAADFAKYISEALSTSQKVALEFDAKVTVDITVLQIVCAACKTAAAAGKTFTPAGVRPESLRHVIQAAGAEGHSACRHNHDSQCFWFGGNDTWQN